MYRYILCTCIYRNIQVYILYILKYSESTAIKLKEHYLCKVDMIRSVEKILLNIFLEGEPGILVP